jgi:heat-inducible transcriptional repressor
VHFVPIDNHSFVAVIVMDTGMVKNTIIKTADTVTPDYLESLTRAVNEIFTGVSIEELRRCIESEDYRKLVYKYRLLETLLPLVTESLEEVKGDDVYADGMSNIFNFPEYADISKAKNLLELLEQKDQLLAVINKIGGRGVIVSIGSELELNCMRDCSLVTATYRAGEREVGRIGIIGPTRMEYERVVAVLEFMAEYISGLIKNE